ncbi:GNAT family N-acetyltransferase [Niallia taxi]|uniref:GNAT family N-acetyltransferase n=1 Tax=Niallia taxi TaxID=2499688 RepID=A0A437K618_9BACI|nr:GNAT family N-acetyltransferase [Niallia taxi]RVT58569.1 GNAT family N-acetyltransferase [Niallia taxi]
MLTSLQQSDNSIAAKILTLQKLSYNVEAEIIGYYNIPPLQEDILHIQSSKEVFLGWMVNGILTGVLSYEETDKSILICRLVVHPEYFRQGIAANMLRSLIVDQNKPIYVCTAMKNTPAVRLYQQFGFEITNTFTSCEGLYLVQLEKKLNKPL